MSAVDAAGPGAAGGAGGRPRGAGRPGGSALRMEAVRLVTLPSTFGLLGAAVGLGTAVGLLAGLLLPARALAAGDTATVITAGGDVMPMSVVGVLAGALAVVDVSHDYRYGLARAVLTAVPRRGRVVAARLTVLSVAGAGTAVLVSALAATLAALAGRRPLLDATTVRVAGFHVLVVVCWAWLGAALGWLVRNAAGALALMLVPPLFLEPFLFLMSHFEEVQALRPVVPWLPFATGRQALGTDLFGSDGGVGALPAAAVFAGTALVLAGAAWVRLRRCDA